MRELEPLSFDDDLRLAAGELERRNVTGEPLGDALPDRLLDPETLHWLRELGPKDPLAPALELWLLRVLEQAEFGPVRAELGGLRRRHAHPISDPEQAQLSLAQMLSASFSRPRERAAYLRGYFASAGELAERVVRLWEERQMFAERLSTSLDAFEQGSAQLPTLARTFLQMTSSGFESLELHDPASLITTLLAEGATEGWPARLTQRTTLELLGDSAWVHGLRVRPFAIPEARGASSFLLALSHAGQALSDAAAARRSPFVLARDVFDSRRQALGSLLALLPLSAAFATRRLGLGPAHVRDQQRALGRAVLTAARVAAYRVLFRELLLAGKKRLASELPEMSHQALGFELPLHAAGVFIRVRQRDSQGFAGALVAAVRHDTLVQTHDEDWFRNPRAVAELRAELGENNSAVPSPETLESGARALAARLQNLL